MGEIASSGARTSHMWKWVVVRRHHASTPELLALFETGRSKGREALVTLDEPHHENEGKGRKLCEAFLAKVAVEENGLKGRPHSAACGSLALAPKALARDRAVRHCDCRGGARVDGRHLRPHGGCAHREGRGRRAEAKGEKNRCRPHFFFRFRESTRPPRLTVIQNLKLVTAT